MYQNILRLEGIMVLLVLCGVALRRRKLITDEGQDCLTDPDQPYTVRVAAESGTDWPGAA